MCELYSENTTVKTKAKREDSNRSPMLTARYWRYQRSAASVVSVSHVLCGCDFRPKRSQITVAGLVYKAGECGLRSVKCLSI